MSPACVSWRARFLFLRDQAHYATPWRLATLAGWRKIGFAHPNGAVTMSRIYIQRDHDLDAKTLGVLMLMAKKPLERKIHKYLDKHLA